MQKSKLRLLCAVTCLISMLCMGAAATDSLSTGGVQLKTAHDAYVAGVPGGYFEPNRAVTRSEAAKMFYGLLDPKTVPAGEAHAVYSDVPADSWFYIPVQRLAASGAFRTTFGVWCPGDAMTRGEFADMIVRTLGLQDYPSEGCPFVDIKDSPYADSIRVMYAKGWAHGYIGKNGSYFGPETTLTRAEAVTFLNRVQGRGPLNFETVTDEAVMFKDNVNMSAWYYYDILEAATSHEHVVLEKTGCEFWTAVK